MSSAKYRRILLKVSGEMLAGEQGYGIQPSVLEGLAAEIAEGMVVVEGQRTPDPRRLAEIEDVMVKLDHAFTFYADSFAQAELDALDVELKLLSRSLAEDIGSVPAPKSKGAS